MPTAWLDRSLAAMDALCSSPHVFVAQQPPTKHVCRLAEAMLRAADGEALPEPDVKTNLNGLALEWHHSSGYISLQLDNDQVELGVSSGTWMAMWPPLRRSLSWDHKPEQPVLSCGVVGAFLEGASAEEITELVSTWSRVSLPP